MLGFALVVALAASEKPVLDWAAALAAPVSPGSVALLVGKAGEQGVTTRLAQALGDASPGVRATAARVAAVSGALALRDPILAALDKEADAQAAAEMMRAALCLGGAVDHPALRAARARFGGALDLAHAEALAWTLGPELFARGELLEDAALHTSSHVLVTRIALRGERAGTTRAAIVALREGDGEAFGRLLAAARSERLDVDAGMLAAAAMSPTPGLRAAACLELATAKEIPPHVIELVTNASAAPPGEPGSDASFACELLRRRLGRAAQTDAAWAARARACGPLAFAYNALLRSQVLRLFTPEERAALGGHPDYQVTVFGKQGKQLTGARALDALADDKPDVELPEASPGIPRVRLASALPSGVLEDLVRITQCRPGDETFAYAQVRFRGDGRPAQLGRIDSKLSKECSAVADAALPLTLASSQDRIRPDRVELLVLPLEPDPAGCDARPLASGPIPVGAGGGPITEPRKTRNVPPVYPQHAKHARIQGIVIVEAVVSEAGCIHELTILRGVHPSLDGAAVRAVSRWRYTPTLLNGRPVPVTMTVTVNFRLN